MSPASSYPQFALGEKREGTTAKELLHKNTLEEHSHHHQTLSPFCYTAKSIVKPVSVPVSKKLSNLLSCIITHYIIASAMSNLIAKIRLEFRLNPLLSIKHTHTTWSLDWNIVRSTSQIFLKHIHTHTLSVCLLNSSPVLISPHSSLKDTHTHTPNFLQLCRENCDLGCLAKEYRARATLGSMSDHSNAPSHKFTIINTITHTAHLSPLSPSPRMIKVYYTHIASGIEN